jgi:HAD superfamily hydrolase (TIGR01490 family)
MEAAFFDLDKTVIARASMVAFGKPLYRHGLISRWLLLRALYGQLVYLYLGADEDRLERMRESVLALTKGWQQQQVRDIVREALDEVVEPIAYAEALELVREHQAAGREVFIASASPEEIVVPVAHWLGVPATNVIATRSRLDEHGRYSGELEQYAYGPAKADAMRAIAAARGIDLEASYAYSDSATDLPMLEAVGHPFAVNPDRELSRAAWAEDWPVLRFSRPVRLRDRVPVPRHAPAVAVSGGIVATSAAATWWWLRREERHPPPPPRRTPAQTVRTFLAATTASAARTARRRSFFIAGDHRAPGRTGLPALARR